MEGKDILRSKNMFALGLVCWLFNRPLEIADQLLQQKFAKKQTVMKANIKALTDGYNYGHNIHLTTATYRVEPAATEKGFYTDICGNTATAYGLIAAAERRACSSSWAPTPSRRPPTYCTSWPKGRTSG